MGGGTVTGGIAEEAPGKLSGPGVRDTVGEEADMNVDADLKMSATTKSFAKKRCSVVDLLGA